MTGSSSNNIKIYYMVVVIITVLFNVKFFRERSLAIILKL